MTCVNSKLSLKLSIEKSEEYSIPLPCAPPVAQKPPQPAPSPADQDVPSLWVAESTTSWLIEKPVQPSDSAKSPGNSIVIGKGAPPAPGAVTTEFLKRF